MATADAPLSLNEFLLAHLRAAGCVRGHFEATSPTPPYVFTGEDAAGQPLNFPDLAADGLLPGLVRGYFETYYSAGYARLLIALDARTGHFIGTLRTPAQEAAHLRLKAQGRPAPPRNRAAYGAALAGQVADALHQAHALRPHHRDYCGMGLECANGHFRYGEVWDGQYLEAQLIFSSREDFVNWLAGQSNKSLARLEEPDPWYWHNQTVTRARLLELVDEADAS